MKYTVYRHGKPAYQKEVQDDRETVFHAIAFFVMLGIALCLALLG